MTSQVQHSRRPWCCSLAFPLFIGLVSLFLSLSTESNCNGLFIDAETVRRELREALAEAADARSLPTQIQVSILETLEGGEVGGTELRNQHGGRKVYPILDFMRGNGLVGMRVNPRNRRERLYRITFEGRERLGQRFRKDYDVETSTGSFHFSFRETQVLAMIALLGSPTEGPSLNRALPRVPNGTNYSYCEQLEDRGLLEIDYRRGDRDRLIRVITLTELGIEVSEALVAKLLEV